MNRPDGLETENQPSMPVEEYRTTNKERCNTDSLSESQQEPRSGKMWSRMSLLLRVLHAHSPVVNPRSSPRDCRFQILDW